MASDRFFEKSGPLNLEEISRICGDAVEFDRLNDDQKALKITDVASLQSATQDHISFLDNVKYKEELKRTNAGVVILHENMLEHLPSTSVPLICKEPYKIYAMIAACFYPESISVASKAKLPSSETVIHPTAIISDIAKIGQGCHIGPYVVIEDDVEIGANTKIEASSMITKGCRIGEQCHIGAHVSLNCSEIGNYVRIHNGARIGQDGFGFAFSETGFIPVPQLGRVIVEDRVNIGANTTIDRGSGPDTVIGQGTIIDNLVQIAHNVKIGKGCIIVAQVGISGSTTLGNYCVLAGQVGVIGHLDIGEGVKVGAQSGVSKSIPPHTDVMGSPAQEKRVYWRELATLRKLSSGGINSKSKK